MWVESKNAGEVVPDGMRLLTGHPNSELRLVARLHHHPARLQCNGCNARTVDAELDGRVRVLEGLLDITSLFFKQVAEVVIKAGMHAWGVRLESRLRRRY